MLQHPVVQVVLGQVFVLLLSFILAYYPSLYLLAVAAYIGLLVGLQVLVSRGARGSRSEVLSSKLLYQEEVDQEVLLRDEKFVEEYMRVLKATLLPSFATMVIAIGVFILAPRYLEHLYATLLGEGPVSRLATWITVFETVFAISWGVRLASGATRVEPITVARSFEVREKGLVLRTGPVPTVIPFPLGDEYEVKLDEDRGFVEIRSRRTRTRIRLYSRRPLRVYELLRRLGSRQPSSK